MTGLWVDNDAEYWGQSEGMSCEVCSRFEVTLRCLKEMARRQPQQ